MGYKKVWRPLKRLSLTSRELPFILFFVSPNPSKMLEKQNKRNVSLLDVVEICREESEEVLQNQSQLPPILSPYMAHNSPVSGWLVSDWCLNWHPYRGGMFSCCLHISLPGYENSTMILWYITHSYCWSISVIYCVRVSVIQICTSRLSETRKIFMCMVQQFESNIITSVAFCHRTLGLKVVLLEKEILAKEKGQR